MTFEQAVTVAGRIIGAASAPLVIAEMSGNHNGNLERALQIVDAAADAGVGAIKLQTYTPDTMTIDVDAPAFRVGDDQSLWSGRSLYDLYGEAYTPWEWHTTIFQRARERGIVPFSAPFDPSAVELLEGLGSEMYKMASAEIVDLPLIREIARTGKAMIISTGMATLSEIESALNAATGAGCTQLVLLACTAAYPAEPSESRLANIGLLHEAFGVPVGISDHTVGIGVSIAAVALGACCIEKHLTLDRADGGVDSAFSLDPPEMESLVRESKAAHAAVSTSARLGPTPSEQAVLRLRRSLYVTEDVRAGDQVSSANVRSIRPAGGLPPDALETLLGRTFTRDVQRGTPLTWDLV